MSKFNEVNGKIADTVTSAYKKIEDTVVGGFTKISDNFVDTFLTRDGESVEDAKARIEADLEASRNIGSRS